jgi:hypothetical protein
MVVGHDPGALGKKGIIGERFGRIFNIDVGMTPDKGYSSGGAMLIDCKKKQPVFTALEAKTSGVFTKRVLHCEARNMQK